jgi:hypothetical protein
VATEHPKITAYVPKEIVLALDDWKEEKDINSRSAAIVTILADYLGVRYPVDAESKAPQVNALGTVLAELSQLKERVAILEQHISTVSIEALSTAPAATAESISAVSSEASSSVPTRGASGVFSTVSSTPPLPEVDAVPDTLPITAPASEPLLLKPLTQMVLAKRLSCSDKAIEKHRKQGDKKEFAAWSGDRDLDGIAWTWYGDGDRGQPLRFVALD